MLSHSFRLPRDTLLSYPKYLTICSPFLGTREAMVASHSRASASALAVKEGRGICNVCKNIIRIDELIKLN